jgi:hypothetical protein
VGDVIDFGPLHNLGSAEVRRQAVEAFYANARLAREDPLAFNEFVLRDEETNVPVDNTETHELMHACVDESDRTIILAHIESGKSNSITIGRTLYEIGHNQNMRGAIVSVSQPNASKFLRSIKTYITDSREYRATFPEVMPGPVWQEHSIIVARNSKAKDPTLQAVGIGSEIIGARLDWVVCDDILNHENTRTKGQRDEVLAKLQSTLFGRLTANARIIILGTAWHKHDALHRLARRKIWFCRRFPVERKDPITGERRSTWPERWPLKRIDEQREVLQLDAKRQLDVQPFDDSEDAFKDSYIQKCLKLGSGIQLVSSLDELQGLPAIGSRTFERGGSAERSQAGTFASRGKLFELGTHVPIFHGVDLARSKKKKGGRTVIFSIALHPNGRRQVIRIRIGTWDGPRIVDEIIYTHQKLGGIFMVENNGTQQWILEFTDQREVVPMYPFTTGNNKANPDYGVESLALEFDREGWIIPSDKRGDEYVAASEEIDDWLDELRDYTREEHTGDCVMGSWFAREGARRFARRGRRGGVGVRTIGG